MNVRKVQEMREDVEYQYICEDSKARVYVSLVPSDAEKRRRRKETVWAFKKALNLFFGRGAAVLVQILFPVAVTIATYGFLEERMAVLRGYSAIGSEMFFAACAGIFAFRFARFVTQNWR